MIFPTYLLSKNFSHFFSRINPSPTFRQKASSQHTTITNLIENSWLTQKLNPKCFLQGSYRRQTSIYTINDIDIIVLCQALSFGRDTNSYSSSSKHWTRDEIFEVIASPLLNDSRYKDKVKYRKSSMCIKVDLGIKIEILPVVHKYPNNNFNIEPFCLYRPEKHQWEDGYARYHQQHLTNKNRKTGNFIPAIKVFKHLRHYHSVKSVSFHIECLLFALPDKLFSGNPATYIINILDFIANYSAENWHSSKIITPCGERYLFTDSEWNWKNWKNFYLHVRWWTGLAQKATEAANKDLAIYYWQQLLGKEYFPREVS
jgi:hypothetical protein